MTIETALSAAVAPRLPASDARASVSVVLPTYNEASNVRTAIAAAQIAVRSTPDHEILVVDDDSPDGTWLRVEELSRRDPRIRCYRRIDRKGLASAIVDGLSMARGEVLVVMDADLQHDPGIIARLVEALETADVAIGSRYVDGGSTGPWGLVRRGLSRLATRLCQWTLGISVSDPMSGFFALHRVTFQELADRLHPRGFKALMEILALCRGARLVEVPYTFGLRTAGASKLGRGVVLDYLLALVELRLGRRLPVRFMQYCLVGLSGVLVQLGAFVALRGTTSDEIALALAILVAMISNFLFNNLWTFRDRRLTRGALGLGLLRFVFVSTLGALINHSVSVRLSQLTAIDLLWTSLVGIALATLWNYQMNRDLTWKMWEVTE